MISWRPFPGIQGGFQGRGETAGPGWLILKQVHGDTVHVLRRPGDTQGLGNREGDALMTDLPKITLAIRTADCLPILLAHPRGVVAAIHAGWRGSAANIALKAVKAMASEFLVNPSEIRAALGPAICGRCFEVGIEVAERFPGFTTARLEEEGKFLLDLSAVNRAQLMKAGLPPESIETGSECTLCREGDYFSYRGAGRRGERNDGRNLSWISVDS